MKTLIAILALFAAACGADSGGSGEVAQKAVAADEASDPKGDDPVVAEIDGELGGVRVLLVGQKLPTCDAAAEGVTFYVEATGLFTTCGADGWRDLDLRGVAGANGEKGDKGDAGEKGETGDVGPQGVAGADGAAGPQGPQGIQGVAGANGEDGEDGIDGLNGLGAIAVKKAANDALVGTSLGATLLVFDGGGLADMNFGNGTYFSSYGYINAKQAAKAYCVFTSNDCSGTCYAHNLSSPVVATMKGTVFYTGSAWKIATGLEVDGGPITARSSYQDGTCSNAFGTHAMTKSFAVTTNWAGPAIPLGALYLDER